VQGVVPDAPGYAGAETRGMLKAPFRLSRLAAVTLLVTVLAAGPACADTFIADPSIPDTSTVTCTSQESGGSPCSLRQAIAAANAAAGNTVSLEAGTFEITQGLFAIQRPMTIAGAGTSASVIDASGNGNQTELFLFATGLVLRNLTVSQASGEDVINDAGGSLTVDGVLFSRAAVSNGVVFASGSVSIQNTTFDSSSGPLVHIQAGATATITSSTFSNETGSTFGVVANQGASVSITNTTFAASSMSAIDMQNPSTATLTYDTFTHLTPAGNGVLVVGSSSSATLRGDVFADGAPECNPAGTAQFISAGANLSDDATCGLTASGDVQNADARLGSLADNGGPVQTVAPLIGSPLVNGAGPCGGGDPTVDARGVSRPQGSGCDIGALEERVPVLAGVPAVSGSAVVGSTLSCAAPPLTVAEGQPTLSYTWRRDGSPIASSASDTYASVAADIGHSIACTVTATNAAGATAATSTAITVDAPAAGGSSGAGTTGGTGGTGGTRGTGAGPGAPASLAVSGILFGHVRGHHGLVRFGRISGRIVPGTTSVVSVKLNRAGVKALGHRTKLRLRLSGLTAQVSGGGASRLVANLRLSA